MWNEKGDEGENPWSPFFIVIFLATFGRSGLRGVV